MCQNLANSIFNIFHMRVTFGVISVSDQDFCMEHGLIPFAPTHNLGAEAVSILYLVRVTPLTPYGAMLLAYTTCSLDLQVLFLS